MKDELLKILEVKLKYLNDNIDALNRMNNNLDFENQKLNYIRSIISLLEDEKGQYSVYNFSKLGHEDFNKVMTDLPNEVLDKFGTSSCNYEGLIYLINGINDGISLTLTKEQIDAIDFMYNSIINRQMDYLAKIDGILLAKSNLDISDSEELDNLKNKFDEIIKKLEKEEYIDETENIMDAIDYNRIPSDRIIEILKYLLEYNAKIYNLKHEEKPQTEKVEKESSIIVNEKEEEELDLSKPFTIPSEAFDIPVSYENDLNELKVSKINEDETPEEENNSFDVLETVQDEVEEKDNSTELENVQNEAEETTLEEPEEFEMPTEDIDEDFRDLATEDNYYEEYNTDKATTEEEVKDVTNVNETLSIPNELNDVSLNETLTVDNEPKEEVKEETLEAVLDETILKELFQKYKVKYDIFKKEDIALLQKGTIEKYEKILLYLEERKLLNTFEKNPQLLLNVLIHSSQEVIDEVLKTIKEFLSVDEEDVKITTNIIIGSLPSVFVKEPNGNYETFTGNIRLFKEYGIDLINLFDFSREVFAMNSEAIKKNYDIVKNYGLSINDKNAKYLLMLPNIEEKLDYYVEAEAKDTMKDGTGKTFDGVEYIKTNPNKLNTVNDITIKRLRYSSENGKKMFGSRENSLAGEITNLKVDVINMDDDYVRKYFNNEFDIISHDEFLMYKKVIQNAKEYSNNLDESLENLEKYRNGLRYTIDGINISRNKLIRNYNILVQAGVDKMKALLFAACYNSVITKEEYRKVKETLSNIGGK